MNQQNDNEASVDSSSENGQFTGSMTVPSSSSSGQTTDSFVASQLLDPALSFPTSTIQAVLNIIGNPSFDKLSLTLKSFSDVFARIASDRTRVASKRTRLSASYRNFPPIVLDNIIDIIESERVPMWDSFQVRNITPHNAGEWNDPAWATLACLSLVHPSWTWPAQKAIGRQMAIIGMDIPNRIRKALTSPLFGPWTRRALISRTIRALALRPQSNQEFKGLDKELANLLASLIKRIPRLHHLALGLELCPTTNMTTQEELLSLVFTELARLKQLHNFILLDAKPSIFPLLVAPIVRLVAQLSNLTTLSVDIWSKCISGRQRQQTAPIAFNEFHPPASLKRLKLILNTSFPMDLLAWLFNPTTANSTPQLQELELTMTPPFSPAHLHGIATNFPLILASINPSVSLRTLQRLTLSFAYFHPDHETIMVEILSSCTSLRTLYLDLRSDMDIKIILRRLPPTLEYFCYSRRFAFDNAANQAVDSFDIELSTWLESAYFKESNPKLRRIHLLLAYRRVPPAQYYHMGHVHTLLAEQNPSLRRSEDVCRAIGVVLELKWNRVGEFRWQAGVNANVPNHHQLVGLAAQVVHQHVHHVHQNVHGFQGEVQPPIQHIQPHMPPHNAGAMEIFHHNLHQGHMQALHAHAVQAPHGPPGVDFGPGVHPHPNAYQGLVYLNGQPGIPLQALVPGMMGMPPDAAPLGNGGVVPNVQLNEQVNPANGLQQN